MTYRQLGASDLKLSTIGVGTWAMGGDDWVFSWGPQDDQDSIDAIHSAVDAGINWIDTAPVYGLGHCEKVVGKAIVGKRDKLIIATKCCRIWNDAGKVYGSLKAESVRKEAEDSLRRLNIDVIDLYQLHWPDPEEDIEEGWTVVAELIAEGKVRYGGVSNFNVEQMKRAQAIHPVTSLQPPYSMLRRDIETEIAPFCAEQNIGIIAYSPMQTGLLTGKYTKERVAALPDSDWRSSKNPYFQEPQLSINIDVVDKLKLIAESKDITMPQLALAWVLRLPEMTSAIVGARSPEQIQETVKAGSIELSADDIAEIEVILQAREEAI